MIHSRNIDTMLDIGANFGLYACTLARHERLREVHCFEPVQRTYNQLCGNIFLNHLDKKITAHRIAASDTAGTADIHTPAKSSGVARLDHPENIPGESESVTLRQLDHVLDFSRRRIFAKIDVEGHEYAVLNGMRRLLRDNEMFLQVEIWDAEKRAKVSALLAACGYVLTDRLADDHYFEKRTAL